MVITAPSAVLELETSAKYGILDFVVWVSDAGNVPSFAYV